MGGLFTSTTVATVTAAGNSTFESIPYLSFLWKIALGIFVGYIIVAYVTKHS
jgi:formate/nitrite transporter FocA (FNT family)